MRRRGREEVRQTDPGAVRLDQRFVGRIDDHRGWFGLVEHGAETGRRVG